TLAGAGKEDRRGRSGTLLPRKCRPRHRRPRFPSQSRVCRPGKLLLSRRGAVSAARIRIVVANLPWVRLALQLTLLSIALQANLANGILFGARLEAATRRQLGRRAPPYCPVERLARLRSATQFAGW